MHEKSIVICVDGNVNAGKTSLLKSIILNNKEELIQYVPEHTDLLYLVTTKNHQFSNPQDQYLMTECTKYQIVKESTSDLFLMDRSFISILAHTIATTTKCSYQRNYVVNKLCDLIKFENVVIPSCFVFLDVPFKTSLKRFNINHKEKGTSFELVEPKYFFHLKNIYSKWIKMVDGYVVSNPSDFKINLFRHVSYDRLAIIDFLKKISEENE